MSILADIEIIERAKAGMITPFTAEQVKQYHSGLRQDGPLPTKIISWGLSSYGYDCRCADRFLIYHNALTTFADPKDFDQHSSIEVAGKGHCFIPPNSFVLTETIEYIKMPRDCVALVAAKSTYARVGLVVNSTIIEPEWEGTITLELSNTTTLPVKVYANEGIIQLIFLTANVLCKTSYADRKGKYNNQRGITLPKV